MADSLTYYIGLIKPEVGASDDTWGEKTNSNWDKIDLGIGTGAFGNTPSKIYVDDADALRVLKAGDTMTGPLVLPGDPVAALQAAPKQYIDTAAGLKVAKAGDTMTGFLTLHANPVNALHAATKQYVDAGVASSVPTARTVTAGAGLTGGGDLSTNRTFDVGAGTGITVAADTVGLDTAHARNVDHSAVSVIAGFGLTGGGTTDATRTISLNAAANLTIKSNIFGAPAAPADNTLTAILDAVIGATRGMILRRNSVGWIALALGAIGTVLKSDGLDVVYGNVFTAPPKRMSSTNLLAVPYYNAEPWTWTKSNADMVNPAYNTSEPICSSFGNRFLQMASAGGALNVAHPTDFRVDKTLAYQYGIWAFNAGAFNFLIASLNAISGQLSTTTIAATVLASPIGLITSGGNNSGNAMVTMKPAGAGAPQWDNATVGATFRVEKPSGGLFIGGSYVVAHESWPATIAVGSIPAQVNGGVGTHECAHDPTTNFAYVLSHSYNTIVKYDAATWKKWTGGTAVQTTGDYPHDNTILGAHVYVACFNGETVNKIDKATMAVVASYPSAGRAMISCCNDGTNIIIGSGTPAQTPFIIKLTVATGTYNIISGDCGGGLSNLPVRVLPAVNVDHVWTVKTLDQAVKRISIGGGNTVATYTCNMGAIYGLGEDKNNLVYANCDDGIAVIDPAAAIVAFVGPILKKYPFRQLYGGSSNMRCDDDGCMWGCTNSGVFKLDHKNGRLHEMPAGFLAGPKWVCNIPGRGMAQGNYVDPAINMLG